MLYFFTGCRGQPPFLIMPEQVAYLINQNISVPDIAQVMKVSIRTIRRIMKQSGLSRQAKYLSISDNLLDGLVVLIIRNSGEVDARIPPITGH